MSAENKSSGVILFLALLLIATSFGVLFFTAFVLMSLWAWFVVPLGVTALSFAHALGINTIIGMIFTYHMMGLRINASPTVGDSSTDTLAKSFSILLGCFVMAASSLGFGFLWQLFM